VLAIATVHKQLHLTGSLEEIDFDAFLHRLIESLKITAPPQITDIQVTAEKSRLRSDLASGMGMLVAELVTNSFKHAYTDGQPGVVAVDYRLTSNGWSLTVSDQGRGLPAGFDIGRSKGVGMQVVKAFVRRLNAKLEVSSCPGHTMFQINGLG
jgi:two-component sensor histidine kinase